MGQTGKNITVDYKLESAFNTAPGATGAKRLRLTPSSGLSLKRAEIRSNEIRADGLSSISRLGSNSVDGSYNAELSVASFDEIIEAIMRSTWVAAVTITEATAGLTSITTTTSTIVASAGSWVTAGVREGDVIRLTNHSTAANNSINLRVRTVSALTITVYGTPLTANAVADTAFTVTVGKKLKNGSTPTRRSFYIEQRGADMDASEVFGGCRFVGLKVTGTPDGMAQMEITIVGANEGTPLSGGASPYFTSPTEYTSVALVFTDAIIAIGGTDAVVLTAFELMLQITASGLPVIGGNTTPDVYDNDCRLSGSFSLPRADLTNITRLQGETEIALHLMLVEPEAEPKDYIAISVPRVKVLGSTAPLGNDGAMIETVPWTAGVSAGSTGQDTTLLTVSTSAA